MDEKLEISDLKKGLVDEIVEEILSELGIKKSEGKPKEYRPVKKEELHTDDLNSLNAKIRELEERIEDLSTMTIKLDNELKKLKENISSRK